MQYIVFDLEFNQGFEDKRGNISTIQPECPFEIVQIGAIKLNENLEILSSFNALVKPKLYLKIHPFVKKVTGLSMDILNTGKHFNDVFKEFQEFINQEDTIFCIWGGADIKELFRNISYHQLNSEFISKEYINVQQFVSRQLNCPKGQNIGLKTAVEMLEIPMDLPFHDALHDAQYTTDIFKKVYQEDIKTKFYDPQKRVRIIPKKTYLDFVALTQQIEKMFKKELSREDKKMIKLAYLMGKSNQFQVPLRNWEEDPD